jgi:hypothetical protein
MIRQFGLLLVGAALAAGAATATLSSTASATPNASTSQVTQIVSARWSCGSMGKLNGRPQYRCAIRPTGLHLDPGTYLVTPAMHPMTPHQAESCSSSKADNATYLADGATEAIVHVSTSTTIRFSCATFRSGNLSYAGAVEIYSATPVEDQN